MLRISAKSLFLISLLPAQSAAEADPDREVQQCLRVIAGRDPGRQLESIRRLEVLELDEASARRLRVAAALGSALRGSREVELAAAQGLMRCADRSGASKELVQRTAQLRTTWSAMPLPKWPEALPLFSGDLKFPPMPEMERNPAKRKRLERELAEYERKAKRQDAEHRRARAKLRKDWDAAMAAALEREAALGRLASFVGMCAGHHDDALVDEWLSALDVCWEHAPLHAAPIAVALCATRRRDVVERCLPLVSDCEMIWERVMKSPLSAASRQDPDQLVPTWDDDRARATRARIRELLSGVHAEIANIGDALGFPAPPIARWELDLSKTGQPPDFDMPDAWKAWRASVLPTLPLRVDGKR